MREDITISNTRDSNRSQVSLDRRLAASYFGTTPERITERDMAFFYEIDQVEGIRELARMKREGYI